MAWVNSLLGDSSEAPLQVINDLKKSAGDRVRVGLRMQLTTPGVLGDDTLEGNESDLTFFNDDIIINQIRNAVKSAGRASEQRVPYDMREEAYIALRDWLIDVVDTSVINQLVGNVNETDTRKTGHQAVGEASEKIYGGTLSLASSFSNLSNTTAHAIAFRSFDAAVARAKTATPVIRPAMVMGGNPYYVAILHPYAINQLRKQTNAGDWADIQKAALQGGQISDNPLFTGAAAIYNSTIILESSRMPTGAAVTTTSTSGATLADFRMGVFMGAQAGALAFGNDSDENLEPIWFEELLDFGNKLGVAAGLIYGAKKLRFNNADFSVIQLAGYAPRP